MKCESGAMLCVRKCASGASLNHILLFVYFREIRICYIYHGQSGTRNLCNQKCSGFSWCLIEIMPPLEDFIATV